MAQVLLPLNGYTAKMNANVLFRSGHNLHGYPALSGFSTLQTLQDSVLPLQLHSVSDLGSCTLRGTAYEIILLTPKMSSEQP